MTTTTLYQRARLGLALPAILLLCVLVGPQARGANPRAPRIQHVILISLDGFHDFDLSRYVAGHPHSAMARLVNTGVTYSSAYTAGPTDSYPGSLALTTGGTPVSTGILYTTHGTIRFRRRVQVALPSGRKCCTTKA